MSEEIKRMVSIEIKAHTREDALLVAGAISRMLMCCAIPSSINAAGNAPIAPRLQDELKGAEVEIVVPPRRRASAPS